MSDSRLALSLWDALAKYLVKLVKQCLREAPALALRIVEIALAPELRLKQLCVVSAIQLFAHAVRRARQISRRGLLFRDAAVLRRDRATGFGEWQAAERMVEAQDPVTTSEADWVFFEQLKARADNYTALQAAGDEYGLMFHLRSELMRKQVGGAGYSRDGSLWLRKHRAARKQIAEYQAHVCAALRYVGSGVAPTSSSLAQRLAFINETRHAFGRTALLLSGGAAFGVKHLGVCAALHREQLLPRILSGTSAGSIVAAVVAVKTDEEISGLLIDKGVISVLKNLTFFGLRRGTSGLDATAMADQPAQTPPQKGSLGDMRRGAMSVKQGKPLLDSTVLSNTLLELCGATTFLQAFDRTGRVLNITVTRSDGKAPPLLCNYITTPQLLVHSAALASCAIPGVFEAVELMAMDRTGNIVPYFKTGGFKWTDGGLQADLPKQRLTELFNVNQFIVSQVNPLAPLFVPPSGSLVFLEEVLLLFKHQLVGFVSGLAQLWQGRVARPAGLRVADLILQEYEGTVTIYPDWGFRDLLSFLANFDEKRIAAYMLDGERATWPHLELIRSLCEVEFTLDAVAKDIQRSARNSLSNPSSRKDSAQDVTMRGNLPSYMSLNLYDGSCSREHGRNSSGSLHFPPYPVSGQQKALPSVTSHASLLNLASLDGADA